MSHHSQYQPRRPSGQFVCDDTASACQFAIAKATLRRVFGSKLTDGPAPFTREERVWAVQVWQDRPEWAMPTLRSLQML